MICSKKRMLLLILAMLLTSQAAIGQPDIQHVEENISQRLAQGNLLGISIAYIYADGRTRFISRGFLKSNRSANIDKDTIFEVGSISKTFTALLLARLVEEHAIALHDPISKYLPDTLRTPSYNGQKITLLDLATHTSGLPRMPTNWSPASRLNPYVDYSTHDLYAFLNNYELSRAPGSVFQYSNLGVGLLGHLLELATHQTYAELLKSYIAEPLQMGDTELAVPESNQSRFAAPYNYGDPVHHWDSAVLAGAFAIRSTTRDMASYMKAQMKLTESPLVKAIAMTHQMHPNIDMGNARSIGLGWIQLSRKDTVIWHNGETGGFRSFTGFNKENDAGVVVLSNGRDNVDDIGLHLLDEAYALRKIRKKVHVDSRRLQKYTGRYKLSPAFYISITRQNGQLKAQATGQPSFRIYPQNKTTFFLKKVDAQIEFIQDKSGDFSILKLFQNGHIQRGTKTKK